jgi:hypothetical protein
MIQEVKGDSIFQVALVDCGTGILLSSESQSDCSRRRLKLWLFASFKV